MRRFPEYQGLFLILFLLVPLLQALSCPAVENTASAIERLDPNFAAKDASGEWLWYDAAGLTVEGKGWTDTDRFYDRLPARAKETVPPAVWSLSRHSAGMGVRFVTDSTRIAARWTVLSGDLAMPHMPATGVSGLDLYVKDSGVWRWIGNGRPQGQSTRA
ncbi:MAG TPA: SGNH/GDSL hydrolase N-terminal domain-containing protein, partial [Candidatus Hydrogenedentes bacterium]|nr:SGNH/GDSL hydrolase N-terminal domain-containing protein [Candidatus Hydrogenedentota bacterium]